MGAHLLKMAGHERAAIEVDRLGQQLGRYLRSRVSGATIRAPDSTAARRTGSTSESPGR